MSIIFIRGLEIDTVIGVFDWERNIRQTVVLDIEMLFDIEKAAQTDNIHYALNYATVSERIISFVENSSFFLIEKLIVEIADLIRHEFYVPWVKVCLIKKEAIGTVATVGIIIERGEKIDG